jgi:HK97 family phage portal protein
MNLKRLFSKEQRSLENPAVSLSSPAAYQWLTNAEPTAAGELVNEQNALSILSVYACVRVLAESIASLPLKVYENLETGRREADDYELYNLLTLAPNPEQTAFSFFETVVGCLALTGNAYAQIQRVHGKVVALWPLHPLKTRPERDATGKLVYRTTDGMADGKARYIDPADIIAIPLFSFDGIQGLSPIQQARQELGLTQATTKFGARFFGNGSKPGGVLSTTSNLNEVQLGQAREAWQSAQGGSNQGKTAVLPGDWKYTQIGVSPEDSQFLSTRAFNRSEIAALFRVPPHLIGDTSRLSNANHEQQQLEFVTTTLRPYMVRIEQEIHRKLLPNKANYFVKFDVRELLRTDFKSQMEGFATGRQWGFFNTNMILEDLGKKSIGPAGDVFFAPVNMVNLDQLLAPATDSEAEPTSGEDVPTPAERNLIRDYASAMTTVFRDGLGRLVAREKRDLDSVSAIFKPLVSSLVKLSEERSGELDPAVADKITKDVLKTIEKRCSDWNTDGADDIASNEFVRVIRAVVVNVAREAAAKAAIRELDELYAK